MKLIVAILDDQDVDKIAHVLTSQHIGVTRVSSTGGLFRPGTSTLLIGVAEEQVQTVMKELGEDAGARMSVVPYAHAGTTPLTSFVEVKVGGYFAFVLNIDHFEQV